MLGISYVQSYWSIITPTSYEYISSAFIVTLWNILLMFYSCVMLLIIHSIVTTHYTLLNINHRFHHSENLPAVFMSYREWPDSWNWHIYSLPCTTTWDWDSGGHWHQHFVHTISRCSSEDSHRKSSGKHYY